MKSAAAKVTKKVSRVDAVKHQATIDKFVGGSSLPGDTSASNSPLDPTKKRRRADQSSSPDEQAISVVGGKFLLPPCYLQGKIFEVESSVVVPDLEASAIDNANLYSIFDLIYINIVSIFL